MTTADAEIISPQDQQDIVTNRGDLLVVRVPNHVLDHSIGEEVPVEGLFPDLLIAAGPAGRGTVHHRLENIIGLPADMESLLMTTEDHRAVQQHRRMV
jgi:hypothetical protein